MKHEQSETGEQHSLTRREFTALTLAAGVAAAITAGRASARRSLG